MYKLDLKKAEEPKIKMPTSARPQKKKKKKRDSLKNYFYYCFIDYVAVFLWITTN